jgi:hypothetical protein
MRRRIIKKTLESAERIVAAHVIQTGTDPIGAITTMKKILFGFTTLALAIASAASYRVTLFQPSMIAGTELKPGDYKIEVKDNKAVVKGRKNVVEADVKMETSNEKFNSTSVRYTNTDGKMKVQEIRLGGTNSKIVFN